MLQKWTFIGAWLFVCLVSSTVNIVIFLYQTAGGPFSIPIYDALLLILLLAIIALGATLPLFIVLSRINNSKKRKWSKFHLILGFSCVLYTVLVAYLCRSFWEGLLIVAPFYVCAELVLVAYYHLQKKQIQNLPTEVEE